MIRLRPVASAACAALALVLASCSSEAPPAPPMPEVNVVTVGTQAVPNIIELPGRVQAYRTAEVRARVDGIVERRLFEEGSYVAAGKALLPKNKPSPWSPALSYVREKFVTACSAQRTPS